MGAISRTYLLAGGAILAALAFVALRGAKGSGAAIGSAAVDMVDGTIAGVVETIGEKVGIPRTDETRCQAAKRQGDTWAASFHCPAGDFLEWVYNGRPQGGASGSF